MSDYPLRISVSRMIWAWKWRAFQMDGWRRDGGIWPWLRIVREIGPLDDYEAIVARR